LQIRQEDEYLYKNQNVGISLNYRKRIFNKHSFSIAYNNVLVSDSVIDLNPSYLYSAKSRNEFLTLTYNFTRDRRDSKNYPLKGHYLSATVQKFGLDIFDNSLNLVNTTLQAKKFSKISDRFSVAGSAITTFSFNKKTPYFLENGVGYGGGVRGYEYYVIDGQNIGIAKAQFRFSLLQPKVYRMGFIPNEKFSKMHFAIYSSIFADVGFVDDQIGYPANNLANEWLFGTGVSLDFVTYYDLVLRTEFSFNKMGESGLFIHFVAPI
jgi:outer membrane protein assembly factor BamA